MYRLILIIFILFFSVFTKVEAQETMLKEISYPYLDTLIRISKGYYARMKVFEAQINIAELNVKRSKASLLDVLNLSYLYSPKNTTTLINPSLLNGYQVGVGINIGNLLQKPSQVRIAKKELEISWLQKDEYTYLLEATVKERYFRYIQSLSTLKLVAQAEIDVQSILVAVRNKFQKGEETFGNYSAALIAFTNQNQAKVAAEAEVFIAKARLEELIGNTLESVKQWQ
ncbi:TolC family protein [Segetibacter sp.]|jgi:outer membrane protein TolC|uniref:TolC family protein n=1 Tax=Segetibacter sp. TaxID=2231182 RepID=UPI002627488A|nr:TolC family protein [Segetibacter sp.]MCW3081237.1 TolC family protein [Segetibacter sp.]